MNPSFTRLPALLALIALLGATAVQAQGQDAVRLHAAAPGKDGGLVGLAVLSGSAYAGSDDRRTQALPLLDYQWANGWFAGAGNGIGYNASTDPRWQYGLRLTADFGRKESRSADLRGMGDIKARPEFGAFLNHAISPAFSLSSSLRYGSGSGSRGLVLDLGAGYSTALSPALRLGVGVGASFGNAAAMQSSFGITPAQATASGYAPYEAGAGLRALRANVSLSYRLTPQLSVTGAVGASRLGGDAKDSPLTRKATQATGLLAVAYAF